MESWFVSVLIATILAGLSNFAFKVASKRNYDAELFSFYGGLCSAMLLPAAIIYGGPFIGWGIVVIMLFIGTIGAFNNIAKVLALRYIDTSLYFPLYKTFTPALAIVFGVIFFSEKFSIAEWIGLLLGLLVPLVLVKRDDIRTQSNLVAGLWLVGITSVISASAAALNKYATVFTDGAILQLVAYASLGVMFGSIIPILYKTKSGILSRVKEASSWSLFCWAVIRTVFITASMWFMLLAFAHGAPLAIANTIQSFYFLIPILLAVVFYREKIGWRRIFAIVLCIFTLILFA